jgi:hypothetical protein
MWSTDGKHDGLYWPSEAGGDESPMGPLVAEATHAGYSRDEGGPNPYHGYYYRLLTAQGAHASGGARDYVDGQGLMTGGFAVIAWPARRGESGVMTFVVSHNGIVFERDLGENTEDVVKGMKAYDPDPDWTPTRQ